MKLRVPEDCIAVSHRGQQIEISADHTIDVDDSDWLIFSTHGFTLWNKWSAHGEFAAMTPNDRVMRSTNATLETLKGIRTEDIGARLLAVENAILRPAIADSATPKASRDVDVESISALNRHELFAFLRARGVSVSLPITNEELRARARRAVG